jgi:CIC family chloride channel protein
VMDTDLVLADADMSFDAFLARPDHNGRVRHVVVTEDHRIFGVFRVNTGLRHVSAAAPSAISLRDVANRNFTVVREEDIVFDVIQRMWRKKAVMALVVRGRGVPRPQDVVGVITKDQVADSVASSINVYPS